MTSDSSVKAPRLFVDMDGTVARFYENANCIDRFMTDPNFFRNLRPYRQFVEALAAAMRDPHPTFTVTFLSAIPREIFSSGAEQKNDWLKKVFAPYGIKFEDLNIIYTEAGHDKSGYIPGGVDRNDYLIDDYSKNLTDWWYAGGSGIKALNEFNGYGQNSTGWLGPAIDIEEDSYVIFRDLKNIFEEPAKDKEIELRHQPPMQRTSPMEP